MSSIPMKSSKSRRDRAFAYLAVLIYASIIGLSFMYTKVALTYASAIDTLALRFTFSFAAIVVLVATGVFRLSLKGKPWPRLLLLALMYPLGFFTLQTFGLKHASSAEGGIIFAITPILTAILAGFFLKEATTLWQKLSILLSVFGVVLIFVMQGSSMDLTNAADGTVNQIFEPLANPDFIWSILYLGILASLVTAFSSSYALSKLEASKISVFSNLSTVISIAAGAFLLGETVTIYHLIGSVFIVVGVIGTNVRQKPKATALRGTKQNMPEDHVV